MGTQLPPPKSGQSTQFPAYICCGQTAGWIKMALDMEVGLGPVHIVLDGDTAPLPQKGGRAPQFSAHLYCGQTAGCIKMPLGMELKLSQGDFVLDGNPAPYPQRGGAPRPSTVFSPFLLWPNGCMDQNATRYGSRSRPRPHCVRWGLSSPPKKGHSAPVHFSAHVYCDQTAGWMKLILGMVVGLSPGEFVLDGDPAPSPKRVRAPSPNFKG